MRNINDMSPEELDAEVQRLRLEFAAGTTIEAIRANNNMLQEWRRDGFRERAALVARQLDHDDFEEPQALHSEATNVGSTSPNAAVENSITAQSTIGFAITILEPNILQRTRDVIALIAKSLEIAKTPYELTAQFAGSTAADTPETADGLVILDIDWEISRAEKAGNIVLVGVPIESCAGVPELIAVRNDDIIVGRYPGVVQANVIAFAVDKTTVLELMQMGGRLVLVQK